MKTVIYMCDWCGAKTPESTNESWPRGWTERGQDLLCATCSKILHEQIEATVESTKAMLQATRS